MRPWPITFLLLLGLLNGPGQDADALDGNATVARNWKGLSGPQLMTKAGDVIYYSFTTGNGSKVNLVVANYKFGEVEFRPLLNSPTASVADVARQESAVAITNAGYFNLSDGVSASYVTIDGVEVANPRSNKALIENPKLTAYLPTIFNRSELRFLKDTAGHTVIQIAFHNAPIPAKMRLVHSVQGGPRLLPELTDKQEAFVRLDLNGKEFDSIGSQRKAARTAFGITPDGYAMMICVSGTGQDPESSGVTLAELAKILRDLGCSQAINFDGGASTSMVINDKLGTKFVCGKTPATKVKSVLLLEQSTKTR